MPKIHVTKPFEARFQPGKPRRQFPVGEHELTQEELDYWFVQSKIKGGHATVQGLAEDASPVLDNLVDQADQVDLADQAAPAPAAKPVKAPAPAAKPQAKSASKPAAKGKGK